MTSLLKIYIKNHGAMYQSAACFGANEAARRRLGSLI